MKAMILAAGLGTRLKPLTDNRPKALVEINGVTMLERLILKLREDGFKRIVVNVHHFSGMVKEFLASRDFGVEIIVSDESESLLDTGGGIVKAMPLLFGGDSSPVLIHNVDIIGNADLRNLMEQAKQENFGALLLVSDRDSSRKLIFDPRMALRVWHYLKNNSFRPKSYNEKEGDRELAFSGIYVMSKSGVEEMKETMGEGKYSVMDYFLSENRKREVRGQWQRDLNLIDIGKPATLLQAQNLLEL